ncbi:MAG: putative nucleotidyltransferase substrate binding domain-containing protein [Thermodesulfobacteriota bacterium]
MKKQPIEKQQIAPEMVLDFLENTLPFKELGHDTLRELSGQCIIDFYPKNTLIFQQDITDVAYLYIVQQGGVRSFLKDEEGEVTLKDFRGEGEHFGALAIIQGTKANLNIETVEDTFCFLFPKDAIKRLLQSDPKATHYFLRSLSEKLVKSAYKELRHHKVSARSDNAFYLFTTQVGEIKTTPQKISADHSVQNAAAEMAKLGIGSLLVEENQKIVGIVTDKDLRTKVVAHGMDYSTPVREIMAAPVQTIPGNSFCFDALITMMKKKMHHLAVESQGVINGIVTTHDLMVVQGTSPLYLFKEISGVRSVEGLYPMAEKIPLVVRSLIEDGAKGGNITRMITIINDHIVEKLLTLLLEKHGSPPVPFCWMLMGSEGRQEQTFLTDQDNALLYEASDDPDIQQKSAEYFKTFSEDAIDQLEKCGFPRCPGNIMASNPELRQDNLAWQHTFDRWIRIPDPKEVLNSTIFFDFRGGFGDKKLAEDLRDHLAKAIPKNELFLYHLANDCLSVRPPLSFFRNFIVEKDGEHKNSLNLKYNGLVPFVDFARVLALKNGIKESNTLGRFQLLKEQQLLSPEFYAEIVDAYEFIMQIRLVHQLHQTENNETPDNYINPARLSDLEKQTLKEAFEVIRRMQSYIKQEFRLGEV